MVPKIFHGEKKKGRFSKDTEFFQDEPTQEKITKFYEGNIITHASILSKTAAFYDPQDIEHKRQHQQYGQKSHKWRDSAIISLVL